MSIKKYIHDGKTLYQVSVNVRSKMNAKIRKQKRKNGIESRTKAERIEKKLYEQAFFEISTIDGNGFLWCQIVEKWHEYKKTDTFEPIGEHTLADYFAALTKWTHHFWDKPAKFINRADIKNLIKNMDEDGRSKSFQSKMKGTVNRVYLWAMEEDFIKEISRPPTWGINVSRKKERTPSILNKEEIYKLLDAAKIQNSPWYPIWAVALLTGCRNGELYALTWDDIDFTTKSMRVSKSYNKRLRETKSTKAGYWRNVPINEDLRFLLLELKSHKNNQYVLPRLRDWAHGYQAKVLRQFCISIDITPIRFHDLRACFATQLLQNKVPPATVMKVCGWKDLDTMGRYIRLAGIDEEGATESLLILPQEKILLSMHSE